LMDKLKSSGKPFEVSKREVWGSGNPRKPWRHAL
jgi:hypothetical protein